jgi:hypothetical protein
LWPEDICSWLASEHIDRGIRNLRCQGYEGQDDGNKDALERPEEHNANEGGNGPSEFCPPDIQLPGIPMA